MNGTTTSEKVLARARMLLCFLMALVLSVSMTPLIPQAYAADGEKADTVYLQLGSTVPKTDVTKNVVTLDANMGKGITIPLDVTDKYNNLSANDKRRYLVLEDAKGTQTQLSETGSDRVGFTSDQIVADRKLKLVTMTKDDKGNFVKRYEQQLNVRFIDTKPAEQKPSASSADSSTAGISADGSQWSFSNGLEVKLQNTGFKFLDGTTINLGALKLPLQYKHNSDGTTIAGINCSPEDVAFFNAVKNGNVWQKYTTEKMAKMTSKMDKGWSGKGFGKWGGKGFDWNVMGFMEFNTKDPNAPRAVNLIVSMGLKAEGHAQYLVFTGTLTFSVGGKATLVGKWTPGKGVEGKFGLGGYGALELYVGLGLNYVASIGTYGKGRIDVDFQVLPKFFLDTIKVSGEFGVKAKAFGFTLFTWKILSGEKKLYSSGDSAKKMPALNKDGTATSPFTVDADTPYPEDSRAYLDNGDGLMAAQSDALTSQAMESSSTILKGIYDETELSCVTTNEGPVIAYIADAAQVGDSSRDSYNRSVLVYTRYKNGKWTDPKIVDSTAKSGKYADYSPSISTDGENCYISWLAADSPIDSGATIGDVGKKLDVNVATITKDDKITVETVLEESDTSGSMPASPKAVKYGNDLYVGWYTNQTSGSEGEVIGVSGNHAFRLYKKSGNNWTMASEVTSGQTGAVTSFDVGLYGDTPACVWSLDEQFASEGIETSLNGVKTLAGSTVYALTSDANSANIVALGATNAQFAKREGSDVLTYAIKIDDNDGVSNPYLSIQSSSSLGVAGETVLDGKTVYLPTAYYEITGDLGQNRAGNISFLKTGDGTCDIQALVTTGAGNTDWTSIVEATADTAIITDYCATYVDGKPLFIFTTERASAANGVSTQADDGSVDMNQTTDESLKHLSVYDIDYDEFEVDAGQKMTVTADFENDGMLDVSGVDLWMLEDGNATKVASQDEAVPLDSKGSISFEYAIPPKDEFTKAREFTLYAAPKGAAVTADKITRELQNESAMTTSFGAASLSLEADQQIIDGQESIVATVTNDGIVPHGATLAFLDSSTGETLKTMDVPALGENETFTVRYNAPHGYFQKDGVKNIIIALENDGAESNGYEINNTEFVSAWELIDDKPVIVGGQPMHRLYNPYSGEHFYTADENERAYLAEIGWAYEGVGWTAPSTSDRPVYRLYNRFAGDHHYTLDANEREYLIGVGWEDEDVGWYSADESGTPLYRQYNPSATGAGSHNYTADLNERDFLIGIGWNDEDIGWYGVPAGEE